jgi:phosphoenolpyruvate synthase/pyruvate phosphate dikinase
VSCFFALKRRFVVKCWPSCGQITGVCAHTAPCACLLCFAFFLLWLYIYIYIYIYIYRGGKGFGLQEMSSIPQIHVPPGFTLTTPLCQVYEQYGDLPDCIWNKVNEAIARVEHDMHRKFGGSSGGGDAGNDNDHDSFPLLFSCRSGAKISMPGMMDTVLNVGLNAKTVQALAVATGGNRRFAYDAYRRLLDMFGDVRRKKENE